MKKILMPVVLFLLTIISQGQTKMNTTTEKSAIEKLINSYCDALNASDVSKVLALYTQDAVFMPNNAPSAVGQEQVKGLMNTFLALSKSTINLALMK